jgi:hypothetical protein
MYRQKSIAKDLEITPKTEGRFDNYNQKLFTIRVNLEGRPKDGPNIQDFEKGSEKFSPARASWRSARPCLR